MRDIKNKLIQLFMQGYCTPQISKLAKATKAPSATLHYNIKKLESEKVIKTYKAVFDYSKIDMGFCTYVLLSLSPDQYGVPEKIATMLAKQPEVESVDICTGDWEIIMKIRTKDQHTYYDFVKRVLSKPGIGKTKSLVSFKQLKSEFIL